jgi:hypothetical protein
MRYLLSATSRASCPKPIYISHRFFFFANVVHLARGILTTFRPEQLTVSLSLNLTPFKMSSFNFKEALSDVSSKTKSGVSTLRNKTQHTPASSKNAVKSTQFFFFTQSRMAVFNSLLRI